MQWRRYRKGQEGRQRPARKILGDQAGSEGVTVEKSECYPDISKHNKSYGDWLDVGDSEGRREGKGDLLV